MVVLGLWSCYILYYVFWCGLSQFLAISSHQEISDDQDKSTDILIVVALNDIWKNMFAWIYLLV